MARKRKTLPDNFDTLCRSGNLDALKAVFDRCEINAYGRYRRDASGYHEVRKGAAPCFPQCPDELIRWLVEQGLRVDTADHKEQRTPLWQRAAAGRDLTVLIELGANVNAVNCHGLTPLHAAVLHPQTVKTLIDHGARVDARDRQGRTPLECSLEMCSYLTIAAVTETARLLLDAGATVPADIRKRVETIRQIIEHLQQVLRQERHQAENDQQSVPHWHKLFTDNQGEIAPALQALYRMFSLPYPTV